MMEEKKSAIDWSIMKVSVITFCICLAIASRLIGGSYYFNSNLSKEFKKNKSIFQSISRRYLNVDQEGKLLREYYPQFVKLYNQGIIGHEKRLNWIETLRQAGEVIKLPSLQYSISSQVEYVPEYNINYSAYTLYSSGMKLDLGLLHEGDLFRLIDYLDQVVDGAYTISECTFRMNGDKIQFGKNAANISATCSLHWITIDLPGDQEIKIG